MQETNNKPISKFLSESLKITIITLFAYILVYIYEMGYFMKLNIPYSFIEVNLFELIGLFFVMLVLSFAIWVLMEIIHISKTLEHIFLDHLLLCVVIILMSVINAYVFDHFKWPKIIGDLVFPIIVIFYSFILPLILGRRIKGFGNKEMQQFRILSKHEPLFFKISEKFGIGVFHIIMLAIILIWLSLELGAFVAKVQSGFLILKTTPELLVLRNYGQKYLCCEFDRDKKEIIDIYYYKTLDRISEEGIMILHEDVGPLKNRVEKAITKQPIKIDKEESKRIEDKKAVSNPKGGIK